ncbi:hypothetical protein QJQ45_018434 [Haematococcus lacustris]|nr:hypothetical protein QJQ45_018434 [Haematococcus lacustris]
MGRRGQRSKKGSAIMAARVAACLAPWTRMAGFIANRLKELEVELQASQTQLGSDVAASHKVPQGQQLEDRVPCGMTLRPAMDDICHQAHKHRHEAHPHHASLLLPESAYYHQAIVLLVAGLCAQPGAGAIGFDSKGDNLGIIMQFALPMGHPAPTNSLSPTPANPPTPTITSTPARPARVVRRPSRFATDSSLLTPPPPSTPFLPSSLSQGSASASPSTPPIQGSEDASKAAGCSASPNYPAACASSSSPPPAPQSVQPGSAFQCCLGFVHLESHDAEHQCAKLIDCFKAAGYWTADVHSACLNPYQTH